MLKFIEAFSIRSQHQPLVTAHLQQSFYIEAIFILGILYTVNIKLELLGNLLEVR